MNDDEPNCWTCAYRDLPETAEPCASCDMYFSHFESTESTESTDTAASEDARRCSLCKFRDTLLVQSPCQKCALTPGLPSFTSDINKLVEMEMMKREEAKQKEAKMAGPTCLTCKHKGVSIKEEPCISCNGYQNYTPDESARRKREEELLKRTCDTCRHRGNSVEEESAEDKEETIMRPTCDTCKYKNLDKSVEPCHSCFYDRFGNPVNYIGATEATDCSTCKHRTSKPTEPPCADCFDCDHHEQGTKGPVDSGVKGIVPKHIVDMFTERVEQAALRSVNERNAHPRPCPYCGEIPEVVEETIYPGEKHCYVVCNGAKHLPHSISVHGRFREEAVAHWNSFAIDIISQRK